MTENFLYFNTVVLFLARLPKFVHFNLTFKEIPSSHSFPRLYIQWPQSRNSFSKNIKISFSLPKLVKIELLTDNDFEFCYPLFFKIAIDNLKGLYRFGALQAQYFTVWKFHDFSVTQILQEINCGESGSSTTFIFAILCISIR